MLIVLGSDHAGYRLKEYLKPVIAGLGFEITDVGCHGEDSVDYPDIALEAARLVLSRGALGVLICGTGQGMAMAANKMPGIRAAVCQEVFSARAAREHNDANILTMGARVIGPGTAELIVSSFLEARFAGGRHQKRLDLIAQIENQFLKREVE